MRAKEAEDKRNAPAVNNRPAGGIAPPASAARVGSWDVSSAAGAGGSLHGGGGAGPPPPT